MSHRGTIIDNAPTHAVELDFNNSAQLRELSGDLGRNFKVVERKFDVRVLHRGAKVAVSGDDGSVHLAVRVLEELYGLAGGGEVVHSSMVEHACNMVIKDPRAPIQAFFKDVVVVGRKKRGIFPRSATQAAYVDAIREHDVVFGVGPAGTGKTYLAVAMAVAALKRSEVERIILARPAVEAGEKLGFLPGDMMEKVNPYLRPLYDALHDMIDPEKVIRLQERGVIEVAPIGFMRGRTLARAFVILDEAQNTSPAQMKMFLTRLGRGSQAVITGDPSQVDLPRGQSSGLAQALRVLEGLEEVAVVTFDATDVVRHPLVSAIIRAYDRFGPTDRGER